MWNRACPLCFTKVPRSLVLTRGEDLTCPSCRASLEISRASRVLAALCGVLVGYAAASHVVSEISATGRWVFGVLGALLGYGIVSAVVLYFVADLVVQRKPPVGHFPHSHK